MFLGKHTKPLVLLLVFTGVRAGAIYAESAKALYKKGQNAEAREDLETAYRDYSMALAKDPSDLRFKLAMSRVRATAAIQHVHRGEAMQKESHPKEALLEFLRAMEVDPGNLLAASELKAAREKMDSVDNGASAVDAQNLDDLDSAGPPVHLDAISADPITLKMTESSSVLYQTIAKIAGLNVLIDPEFSSKTVTIDLKNVTSLEALRVLGDLSNSFWKASTHNTIYVAADTRAKRTQLERLAIRTFYLSNATQQNDANDIITTLRNMLPPATKVFAVQTQNAIVIRATTDEIMLAKNLIESLDRPRPEVLVDVYVMEVRRDKLRNIGISLPTSLTVTSSSSATLNAIGKTSSYSYSIGQAAVELLLTDSDTRVLQQPSIRAIDGQKASLKIGSKIPIATGSYTTGSSTTSAGTQTQFQYIDVGVNVDITPTIHEDRDVTLKLSVEVSSQSGTSVISGVSEPIISQQKAEQVIRLKDGEVNILAGLVQKELTHTVSGTPGLGEVPGVKYLFSTQQNEVVNDEIIFMLVPHVVRAVNVTAGAAREIETGGADSVLMDRISPAPKPLPAASAKDPQ